MKQVLFFSALMLCVITATGQPSEAEIRKQITNEGTKSIKFSKSTGTRQWNKDIGNWEYVRGVEVMRKSDYAGIDLVVVGDVVYQYTGVGKYSYWKFRTISNQYFGIPNPSSKDIKDILSKDWQKFYGYYFQKITKEYFEPALADDPTWIWHNPNSVEFKMKLKFDHIISYTEIETAEAIWNVRLYRDDPRASWKSFFANRSQEASENKKMGVQKYTNEQVRDMEKQTLAYTLNEKTAKEQMAALPKVDIPSFTNAEDMVKFVHNIMRNGTPEQFRSAGLQLFAPGFFVEGSKVQFAPAEEQNLEQVLTVLYRNKATYKQMYCQNPNYRIEKWGNSNSKKTIYIDGAIKNTASQFTIDLVNIGYVEGVAQTKLMILQYRIYVNQEQDAINFVNSFSDRKKLCPND